MKCPVPSRPTESRVPSRFDVRAQSSRPVVAPWGYRTGCCDVAMLGCPVPGTEPDEMRTGRDVRGL